MTILEFYGASEAAGGKVELLARFGVVGGDAIPRPGENVWLDSSAEVGSGVRFVILGAEWRNLRSGAPLGDELADPIVALTVERAPLEPGERVRFRPFGFQVARGGAE